MIRMTYREQVAERLFKGMPKAKPFGRLINGRFVTGTLSLHTTKQAVNWRAFNRLRQRVDAMGTK